MPRQTPSAGVQQPSPPPSSPTTFTRPMTFQAINRVHERSRDEQSASPDVEAILRIIPDHPAAAPLQMPDRDFIVANIRDRRRGDEELEYLIEWADTSVLEHLIHTRMDGSQYVRCDGKEWPVASTIPSIPHRDTGEVHYVVGWEATWQRVSTLPDVVSAIRDFERDYASFNPSHTQRPADILPSSEAEIPAGTSGNTAYTGADLPEVTPPATHFLPQANVNYLPGFEANVRQEHVHVAKLRPLLARLLGQRPKRALTVRQTFVQRGTVLDLGHHERQDAALAFTRGKEWTHRPCEGCVKGLGPFPACVTYHGYAIGACANCVFRGARKDCNYHTEARVGVVPFRTATKKAKTSKKTKKSKRVARVPTTASQSTPATTSQSAATSAALRSFLQRASSPDAVSARSSATHSPPPPSPAYVPSHAGQSPDPDVGSPPARPTLRRPRKRASDAALEPDEPIHTTSSSEENIRFEQPRRRRKRRKQRSASVDKPYEPESSPTPADVELDGDHLSSQRNAGDDDSDASTSVPSEAVTATTPTHTHHDDSQTPATRSTSPVTARTTARSTHPSFLVHNHRRFVDGEATITEIRFILAHCDAHWTECLAGVYSEWIAYAQKNGLDVRYTHEEYLACWSSDLVNLAVAACCPEGPARKPPPSNPGRPIVID